VTPQERFQRAADIFLEVARSTELDPGTDVESLLQQRCEGDAELLTQVRQLLAASKDESVFKTLAAALGTVQSQVRGAADRLPTSATVLGSTPVRIGGEERPGYVIGRYTLVERLGEGGFGSVWVAEQSAPIKRRVALKVLKAGMDTAQVVARFEQERQALAIMDHPNIAKVFDAGATETGRPYFVMELCKGEPISEFCDRVKLSIEGRLALFEQVCSAVQHAHTKGIIHRDLKPTNILVAEHEGNPRAHVIDFGIAKATANGDGLRKAFTEQRQFIGTPEYMSPEQADGSADIDTRTDIYALGVVLYELLTGTTPFSSKELRSAAYAEIQRIIREVDPPKPSTRISQSREAAGSVAADRQLPPDRLGTRIKGELDWIVMKAIDKDRDRRYETAEGFAADVRRFLAGEAVLAAPPSAAYRTRKFVGRHRGPVAAAGAIALTLVAGVVAFAWQAKVTGNQRDRAIAAESETAARADELAKVADFQAEMLSKVDAAVAGEQLLSDLRERFDKSIQVMAVPEAERPERSATFARDLERISGTDAAVTMIDRTILTPSLEAIDKDFADQPTVAAALRHTIANVYRKLGRYNEALPIQRGVVETRERLLGKDDARTIASLAILSDLLGSLAMTEESVAMMRDGLERSRRTHGPEHFETLSWMSNLGTALSSQRNFAEAEPLLREALEGRRRTLGSEKKDTLVSLNTYGTLLIMQGKAVATEPYWREAYETSQRVLGPDDADSLVFTANMGGLMTELGRWSEAERYYLEAAAGFTRTLGAEHPNTLSCLQSACFSLSRQGKYAEAGEILGRILVTQQKALGPEHPSTIRTMLRIGGNLRDQEKYPEAESVLRETLELSRRALGPDNSITLDAMAALRETLARARKFDESNALAIEHLAASERVFGKEHASTLTSRIRYGDSLRIQGRREESEKFLREGVEATQRVQGPKHIETAFALDNLAALLADMGKLDEAEALLREAVSIFEANVRPDAPPVLRAKNSLAGVLTRQGKLDEAEPLARSAAADFARVEGNASTSTQKARETLAKLLIARKDFAGAEAVLLESHQGVTQRAAERRAPDTRAERSSIKQIIALYEAWEAAQPGKGAAGLTLWRSRLEAMGPEPLP
jgi:non-specific serine/threonine protein kinase/serine/threonine-protein kinase